MGTHRFPSQKQASAYFPSVCTYICRQPRFHSLSFHRSWWLKHLHWTTRWFVVLPVEHFIMVVSEVDSSSLINPAAVLVNVPWTKNVSLSDISVLNTVRPLQLDTDIHLLRTHFGLHYWLRHVDWRFYHCMVRVFLPVVGEAVAGETVTCSTNITLQADPLTKRNTFKHKINWNE